MGPMFMNINREKPALASPVSSRIQGRNVTWSLKGRSRYHLGKIPRLCLSSPLCRSVSFFCLCQPTVAALLALMDQITIPQLHSDPSLAAWRESPSLLAPIPSSHRRDYDSHNLGLVPTPSPKNCDQGRKPGSHPYGMDRSPNGHPQLYRFNKCNSS